MFLFIYRLIQLFYQFLYFKYPSIFLLNRTYVHILYRYRYNLYGFFIKEMVYVKFYRTKLGTFSAICSKKYNFVSKEFSLPSFLTYPSIHQSIQFLFHYSVIPLSFLLFLHLSFSNSFLFSITHLYMYTYVFLH